MSENLTNTIINNLKAGDKEITISDSNVTGLRVRVTPTGTKTFYFYYRLRGKLKKYRIGKCSDIGVPEARRQALKLHGKLVNGIDPADERMDAKASIRGSYLLKNYLEDIYNPDVDIMLKSAKRVKYILKHNFKKWMNTDIAHIDPALLNVFVRTEKKRGIAPSTINRAVQGIKAVISHAVENGYLEHNKIKGYKLLKLDKKGVVRYLSADEERDLVLACKDLTKPINTFIILLLNTGMRPNEAKHLIWSDISLSDRVVIVRGDNTKSGQTRYIPLNEKAIEAITTFKLGGNCGEKYVFETNTGKPIYDIYKKWVPVRDRAGILNFRMYDLRHTFASKLAMKGVDLNTIRELLGHASLEMTLIYSHLSDDHKRSAVDKL